MNPGPDSINLDLVLELVISIYSSFKRSAIYLSAVAPPLLVRILNCSLSNLQDDIRDKFQLNFFLLSLSMAGFFGMEKQDPTKDYEDEFSHLQRRPVRMNSVTITENRHGTSGPKDSSVTFCNTNSKGCCP